MIEGLKVTLLGAELREICLARVEHHLARVRVYEEQIASMQKAEIEGMKYTNGDPLRALTEKKEEHANEAGEMRFIAEHLKVGEEYLLDRDALHKLGIMRNRY